MNPDALEPKRHAPPEGWDVTTFEAVTDALAAALVAAVRRAEREPRPPNHGGEP